jgi:membrane dipeptidase
MRLEIARLLIAPLVLAVLIIGCGTSSERAAESQLRARADSLARAAIIVDGHIDIPWRLMNRWEDVSVRTPGGDFDYERAVRGGLNAPFMSIYIPASRQERGGARALADSLIDMVYSLAADHSDKFAVATTVDDVRRHFEEGLISLPMGMENGAGLEEDIANVLHFYERGIRYISLTHSADNLLGDSSYDTTRTWGGLSPFGRDVVREMNQLGVMVDVSHVSDDTFYDIIAVSETPVIASHSSARHFTPGFERNMSDDMIRALADNGGVIMINFGSYFIDEDYRQRRDAAMEDVRAHLSEHGESMSAAERREYSQQQIAETVGFADISDVMLHFDHVIELVGIDHVGIGSDYDGVGDSLPTGLKDVSEYPNLVYELLRRGLSNEDIRKILGENVLRVWSQVEAYAQAYKGELSGTQPLGVE